MSLDLKAYVLSTVQPNDYYHALYPDWSPVSRPNVSCPFHDDATPSLSIGLSGGGAKCHAAGCGIPIGNIVHFESRRNGITEVEAAAAIYDRHIRPVVPSPVLETFRNGLRTPSGQRMLDTLHRDHGLANEVVTSQFNCGYDQRSNRLVIPIYNAYGLLINLRFYKPRKLRTATDITLYNYVEAKGTPNERRYGGNELFPWPQLANLTDDYPLFIMASEKETILAYQLGLQAVCATAGEGSWQAGWSEMFTGRRVGILMDPDRGGEQATSRLMRELSSVSLFSIPIRLPFTRGFRGPQDFDDWVVHSGGSGERLLALFEQLRTRGTAQPSAGTNGTTPHPTARRVLPKTRADPLAPTGSIERHAIPPATGPQLPPPYEGANGASDLAVDAIRRTPDALNRIVTSQGLVSGIAQKSYSVPFKFRVKPRQGPPIIYVMQIGRQLLGFINGTDDTVIKTVLSLCGASKNNTTVEAIEHHTVTELELIPMAESAVASGDAGGYTVQRCFAFGVTVSANIAYAFRLVPTTMPQSQETVGVIIEAKEIDRQEDFKLTSETFERFALFRPQSEKETGDAHKQVWKRLELLAAEIAEHHTHIYERPDWHMVVLLTFFSPLQWTWPLDNKTQRGWMNTLAVGDTKTGKSEVTNIVTSQLLKAGAIINSENCTYVGLVGGAIKGATGQFMLRWGRIPLGDRKLVVLEELSGLSVEEISNMSDVRSSGVARLDKGGLASQTPARTRLLCLSNVRSKTKRLADFLSGVKAVQELVGHAEDISRFDLIITLTDAEVSAAVINRASTRRTTRPSWNTSDLRLLCQWVWSLKPDQINITADAARRCLELTLELGKDYHSGCPIFKASSDRHKVARIAVSIACIQFAFDGGQVVVTPAHMESAVQLLRGLYDKPSLGYREWSRQMFDREKLRDQPELDNIFRSVQPNGRLRARSAEVMIHSAKFSRDELCATATLTITQADLFLGTMLRCRATRKGEANTWEITPAGKRWLEEVISTAEIETSQRSNNPRTSLSEAFDKTPHA